MTLCDACENFRRRVYTYDTQYTHSDARLTSLWPRPTHPLISPHHEDQQDLKSLGKGK